MIEYLQPFTTFALEEGDFSPSDLAQEMQRYVQRQKAITACLHGTQHPDVLLDMLEAHSIDPVEYVNTVVANVETVITQNLSVNLWG